MSVQFTQFIALICGFLYLWMEDSQQEIWFFVRKLFRFLPWEYAHEIADLLANNTAFLIYAVLLFLVLMPRRIKI